MKQIKPDDQYVIFVDAPEKPYLKPLKRGFRHCIYCERQADVWITIDPLSSHTEILTTKENPIPSFKATGFLCVKIKNIFKLKKKISIELMSCVGQIKRLLGIQSIYIQTPYQLFLALQRNDQHE